jgi:hypothetical protein
MLGGEDAGPGCDAVGVLDVDGCVDGSGVD